MRHVQYRSCMHLIITLVSSSFSQTYYQSSNILSHVDNCLPLYVLYYFILGFVRFMVLNATFNNMSVISWQSVLLVEETGENHLPVGSHWQTMLYWVHLVMNGVRTHNFTHIVVKPTTIRSRPLQTLFL